MQVSAPMDRLYRATSLFLIAAMLGWTTVGVAQSGSLTCSSNDGAYHYCRADTQNQVRLTQQLSGSSCQQGYSWGYDYRGIWVDRGCRAEFQYGNNDNGGGSDNTGAAIAAGILGAIVIGSIVASQNNTDNSDTYELQRDEYWDGYRRGQLDWDQGLDPNYLRYSKWFSRKFESDFSAGYNDGFYNRPSRYR